MITKEIVVLHILCFHIGEREKGSPERERIKEKMLENSLYTSCEIIK